MAGNSFGEIFRVSTFGESHGTAIGAIIDGCPAGLSLNEEIIQLELDRRKPGQSRLVSPRKEEDKVEILSGVFEGITLGTPIAIVIRNKDQQPDDYAHLKESYRPSHADFTYESKYGRRDYRGGGRASARETAARVAAGAIAKQLLSKQKIQISGFVSAIGKVKCEKEIHLLDLSKTELSLVRCPDDKIAQEMVTLIETTQKRGDTVGGIVSCVIQNAPVGLGEPIFDKLHADLGKAMLSINAVHGFEYGSGFAGTEMYGSDHNDLFEKNEEGRTVTKTNHSGGIQGGISNGMDIFFRVAFKPVATLMQAQKTLNKAGNLMNLEGKGRHDACVVPRAVPIVEAMAALVLADHYLRQRSAKI